MQNSILCVILFQLLLDHITAHLPHPRLLLEVLSALRVRYHGECPICSKKGLNKFSKLFFSTPDPAAMGVTEELLHDP